MQLEINGTARELQKSGTVSDLILELGLVPQNVLVEHNGLALHRSEWKESVLSDGDKIELLQVAAGG